MNWVARGCLRIMQSLKHALNISMFTKMRSDTQRRESHDQKLCSLLLSLAYIKMLRVSQYYIFSGIGDNNSNEWIE